MLKPFLVTRFVVGPVQNAVTVEVRLVPDRCLKPLKLKSLHKKLLTGFAPNNERPKMYFFICMAQAYLNFNLTFSDSKKDTRDYSNCWGSQTFHKRGLQSCSGWSWQSQQNTWFSRSTDRWNPHIFVVEQKHSSRYCLSCGWNFEHHHSIQREPN